MSRTIVATFDGTVLRPVEPLNLREGTRVLITIEDESSLGSEETNRPRSFLETARSLQLEGPPDWSTNIEKYLDGEDANHLD